jgi:CBS domain-containing protein
MGTVRDIMIKEIVTVKETETLEKVCKLLVSKKLSGIPVVGPGDDLVGFISERDIIAAVGSKNFQAKKTGDVMTRKVVSIDESTPVDQISQLFTDKPFRYIPVTRGGRLVGIVTRKSVINKLLGQYY